ncbi:hypothetical protein ACP275_04G141800 [Erythranthe tilingii]
MAASMVSTTATAAVSRATAAQASMVAPFTGLKSTSAFPATRKSADITTIASNGGRVSCMKVWPTVNNKKYETLSYLPPLTREQLIKEVDYLLRNKLIPCIEFELEVLDLCSVSTTAHQDTTTADTGQCGSCLCSGALTQYRL